MFTTNVSPHLPKAELYTELTSQLRALIDGETDATANMANCAALLFNSLPQLNWAGFYLLKGGDLVLGPFQGRPACVRIALGRGVCGKAAQERTALRVADVNAFADHIACDNASRSEVVLPLLTGAGDLLGVLDLDSPQLDRFDPEDEAGLRQIADIIAPAIDPQRLA